ncbi:MAG: FeoB-associated Cys-rich membrane protein [Winogradskyella arenosi]|uniref:Attachment p12 family protein n=1 Tax=Winogradskyella arenosi TaxID=533325 RepID=A0A368ZNE3_9FLAO|nr:FeoB-associated Cys-rich membrane protein [Winogradskyella arenosi]RCW93453.1 hypothetical protein DFQ08_101248 [Winogradskyella arenosi]
MNTIIQNILVYIAVGAAVLFLVKKYVLPMKKKSTKACGGDDGCGCH